MKLIYVKRSLEISQENGWGSDMAMWHLFNSPCPTIHPDGSTVTMDTIKALKVETYLKWRAGMEKQYGHLYIAQKGETL